MLVFRPRILLTDESFGVLDAQTQRMMQMLLLDIGSRIGATAPFVTPHTLR